MYCYSLDVFDASPVYTPQLESLTSSRSARKKLPTFSCVFLALILPRTDHNRGGSIAA